jgi:hypothetical protein
MESRKMRIINIISYEVVGERRKVERQHHNMHDFGSLLLISAKMGELKKW